MSETRIVSLQTLLGQLEEVLGADSLLFKRFQQGLQLEDEQRLTEAMRSLRLYPAETRRRVEDTVMSWLFGNRQLQRVPSAGALPKR